MYDFLNISTQYLHNIRLSSRPCGDTHPLPFNGFSLGVIHASEGSGSTPGGVFSKDSEPVALFLTIPHKDCCISLVGHLSKEQKPSSIGICSRCAMIWRVTLIHVSSDFDSGVTHVRPTTWRPFTPPPGWQIALASLVGSKILSVFSPWALINDDSSGVCRRVRARRFLPTASPLDHMSVCSMGGTLNNLKESIYGPDEPNNSSQNRRK
ncbi:hypothetical protein B0H16DRAFT_335504 [Mycena metata]|uniref:Uncharacterized protein n=1 Tax=Mycena metata TaxID=1033252 RepID=A0AAD7JLV1_9AGAR|nr:hypothetical protein B0H16DRAFT_335504 [Mycena metata]